jgi:hypothetical protein
MERICIYPHDVARITGRSTRYGRKIIRLIKLQSSRPAEHLVTIEEFCNYTGISKEEVVKYLR